MFGPRLTSSSSLQILWYRILQDTGTTQNLNLLSTHKTGLVEIEEQTIVDSTLPEVILVRSMLNIGNLNTDNISGDYWCTVKIQDQRNILVLQNESPLTLLSSSAYQDLEACPEGAIHTSLANNIPLLPTTPSVPSSTSAPVSLTPSLSTPMASTDNTTYQNMQTNTAGTEDSTLTSSETRMSSFLDMNLIIIFSLTIGVLIFVVHGLLVVVICLCYRDKRRGSKNVRGMTVIIVIINLKYQNTMYYNEKHKFLYCLLFTAVL